MVPVFATKEEVLTRVLFLYGRVAPYGRSPMPSLAKRICPVSTVEGRRKALNDLLAEQWEYSLRISPIYASFLGDKRWNDKLDDFSQEAVDKDLEATQKFLARVEAVDSSGFLEQEALDKTLMVRDLKMQLEGLALNPGKCR
jgi:uncharacterized protein (DUF885 family)